MKDHVDYIIESWAEEDPEIDMEAFHVIGRVMRLAWIFESAESRLMKRFGLNRTEFGILTALRRSGPDYAMTPAELGAAVILTSGAMTKRLDSLEGAGLVTREPSKRDRRAIRVALTDKGKELVERALAEDLVQEERLVQALDESERKKFAELARKLLLSLDETVFPSQA